jgi:hypothetical protein
MNQNIADIIYILHLCIIIYITFGFMITPIKYLKYYLYFIIFILLMWNYNNSCSLTELEYYYRNDKFSNGKAEFFRPIVNNLFDLELNSYDAGRLNYITFLTSLLFGFIRYNRYCK